jgi:hypothetical protein
MELDWGTYFNSNLRAKNYLGSFLGSLIIFSTSAICISFLKIARNLWDQFINFFLNESQMKMD